MIWNQFLTGRPVATCSNRAESLNVFRKTHVPNGISGVLVGNDWMAEVFREEWCWNRFGGIGGSVISVSPLASVIAVGNNISGNTSLNESGFKCSVHWSTEIMIWDQIFAIRPVTCGSSRDNSGASLFCC